MKIKNIFNNLWILIINITPLCASLPGPTETSFNELFRTRSKAVDMIMIIEDAYLDYNNYYCATYFFEIMLSTFNYTNPIGGQRTLVGTIGYHSNATVKLPLRSGNTYDNVILNGMPDITLDMVNSVSYLDNALAKANQMLLKSGRNNTSKIVFMLVTNPTQGNPVPMANKMKSQGGNDMNVGWNHIG
ncbi:unnamed protein product [Gordionus sp. m RMFG-2023]